MPPAGHICTAAGGACTAGIPGHLHGRPAAGHVCLRLAIWKRPDLRLGALNLAGPELTSPLLDRLPHSALVLSYPDGSGLIRSIAEHSTGNRMVSGHTALACSILSCPALTAILDVPGLRPA